LCKRIDVNPACPVACGACCADDSTYTFTTERENYPDQDCAWIEKKFEKRKKYCKKKQNKAACALTCNNCQTLVELD